MKEITMKRSDPYYRFITWIWDMRGRPIFDTCELFWKSIGFLFSTRLLPFTIFSGMIFLLMRINWAVVKQDVWMGSLAISVIILMMLTGTLSSIIPVYRDRNARAEEVLKKVRDIMGVILVCNVLLFGATAIIQFIIKNWWLKDLIALGIIIGVLAIFISLGFGLAFLFSWFKDRSEHQEKKSNGAGFIDVVEEYVAGVKKGHCRLIKVID